MKEEDATAVKEADNAETLEANAAELAKEIGDLDSQIKALSTQRTKKHKELRAITSRLVTIKLRGA